MGSSTDRIRLKELNMFNVNAEFIRSCGEIDYRNGLKTPNFRSIRTIFLSI